MLKKSPRSPLLASIIIAVYLVQGAVAIIGISEFLLTRNLFQFSWVQIAMLGALATLAWSIKPIYGFLTDLVPIAGLRRKYYLIISSLLPFFAYITLAFYGNNFLTIALCLVIANVGLGFADVIADGLVVERSSPTNVGWYQSLCWRAKAIGIFIAALFSGLILERQIFSKLFENSGIIPFLQQHLPSSFPTELTFSGINIIDIRFTFLIAAILPIITFALALILKEQKESKETEKISHKDIPLNYVISAGIAFLATGATLIILSTIKTQILPFIANDQLSSFLVILIWAVWIGFYIKHLIKIKAATSTLLYAALFLFLWRFTPSFGAPWSNYFLNDLQLPQEKIGFLSTITPLAWIIGSFIYTKFIDKINIKKVLLVTVLLAALLGLSQLLLATPEIATTIGNFAPIKYFASIVLYPAYFFAYGTSAWTELMTQSAIINLDAFLAFFLELMFIISFLPLLKLAALVTPKGVEATNFAILASIMNLGLVFGAITGGLIYTHIEGTHSLFGLTYTGLHLTIIISAATSLICLLVLRKIKVK